MTATADPIAAAQAGSVSDRLDSHSHVVRPANMEWQKTRFPGCEVKTLLFDRNTGMVTALMRFAPGAVLPDHEHVKIEQTYVLEGTLVEGPAAGLEVNAGEFVWREGQPPCGLHARWRTDAGHVPDPQQIP
jgi:anti-sigma factor ChrR (cupin superfamily)